MMVVFVLQVTASFAHCLRKHALKATQIHRDCGCGRKICRYNFMSLETTARIITRNKFLLLWTVVQAHCKSSLSLLRTVLQMRDKSSKLSSRTVLQRRVCKSSESVRMFVPSHQCTHFDAGEWITDLCPFEQTRGFETTVCLRCFGRSLQCMLMFVLSRHSRINTLLRRNFKSLNICKNWLQSFQTLHAGSTIWLIFQSTSRPSIELLNMN